MRSEFLFFFSSCRPGNKTCSTAVRPWHRPVATWATSGGRRRGSSVLSPSNDERDREEGGREVPGSCYQMFSRSKRFLSDVPCYQMFLSCLLSETGSFQMFVRKQTTETKTTVMFLM